MAYGRDVVRRWLKPLLGATVCVILVARLRWEVIADALGAVGPWFAAVAALDLACMVCDAAAIRELAGRSTSLANAFAAQATGYVLNRLTPGGTLGEPLKVARLSRQTSRDTAVSAILLYNLATFGGGVVTIVIGAPIAVLALDLPGRVAVAVAIASGVLAGVLVAAVVLVRRRLVARAIGAVRALRVISAARADRWRDRTRAVDARLASFGDAGSRMGVLFVLASRALDQLGTLVLLHALGVPAGLELAVVSLGVAITWAANAMPLGLGVADGGHCALFAMFGANPAFGVVFAMIERTRAAILAVGGITIAAWLDSRPPAQCALPSQPSIARRISVLPSCE